MTRKVLGMMLGLLVLAPVSVAHSQTQSQAAAPLKKVLPPKPDVPVAPGTEPSSFGDGVKALLQLDYAGMSKETLSKATSWPLTFMDAAWSYKASKTEKGDDYLYGGSDIGGAFSLSYSEIYMHDQHHFVVQALATRAPLPEGNGCLRIRDIRPYAESAHWTGVQNYVGANAHGFTAQKGLLTLDVRVDLGSPDLPNPNLPNSPLDDQGCVSAVRIQDTPPVPPAGTAG